MSYGHIWKLAVYSVPLFLSPTLGQAQTPDELARLHVNGLGVASAGRFRSVAPADTVVSYCGGEWGWVEDDRTCSFPCFAGDQLRVVGHCGDDWGSSCYVTVIATCGGATVNCSTHSGGTCEVTSEEAVVQDDPNGSCVVMGDPWGWYFCRDVILDPPDPKPGEPVIGVTVRSPSDSTPRAARAAGSSICRNGPPGRNWE